MVFVEGVPQKIDRFYFRAHYGCKFPRLLQGVEADSIIDDAIEAVYDIYTGVSTLWNSLDDKTWHDKTRRCYGLLAAWYVTDMHPMYAIGIQSTGGLPIKSKQVGGVKIVYNTDEQNVRAARYKDALSHLRTNTFGINAYNMIKTSGKMIMLRSGGR